MTTGSLPKRAEDGGTELFGIELHDLLAHCGHEAECSCPYLERGARSLTAPSHELSVAMAMAFPVSTGYHTQRLYIAPFPGSHCVCGDQRYL